MSVEKAFPEISKGHITDLSINEQTSCNFLGLVPLEQRIKCSLSSFSPFPLDPRTAAPSFLLAFPTLLIPILGTSARARRKIGEGKGLSGE